MRTGLIDLLDKRLALNGNNLQVFSQSGEHIEEGLWQAGPERWIPITGGVPCFLSEALRPDFTDFCQRHGLTLCMRVDRSSQPANDQALTAVTFSDKWSRFRNYGLDPNHKSFLFDWYCKKLGKASQDELKAFYRKQDLILEVGPGSGFNTRFMAEHTAGTVIAADISQAAYTTFGNTRSLPNCHVVQADLMDLPFADDTFDFVIADGVLHHTPDTHKAVVALFRKVKPGGQFFFYVYKKMGAGRYFCDQYIREHFSKLEPDECYAACEGLTALGRELSRLGAKITLEQPIAVLGIPAGTHDVQRLLYYNFVKCFWNEAFDFETNNMVNFDWYHPHLAWQHSEAEVEDWLSDLGVTEFAFHAANPNGISVLLRKPQAVQRRMAG
jgi:SAM-dependent methyltransferase